MIIGGKKLKLRPLADRIVIKKVEVEEKTKSGILLTGSAQEQPQMAEVIAISEDIKNDDEKKDQLSVGDTVIFSKYSGTEVKVDGEEVTILKLEDILAVIE